MPEAGFSVFQRGPDSANHPFTNPTLRRTFGSLPPRSNVFCGAIPLHSSCKPSKLSNPTKSSSGNFPAWWLIIPPLYTPNSSTSLREGNLRFASLIEKARPPLEYLCAPYLTPAMPPDGSRTPISGPSGGLVQVDYGPESFPLSAPVYVNMDRIWRPGAGFSSASGRCR